MKILFNPDSPRSFSYYHVILLGCLWGKGLKVPFCKSSSVFGWFQLVLVGKKLSGWLQLQHIYMKLLREVIYFFGPRYLESTDGSQLFIGAPSLAGNISSQSNPVCGVVMGINKLRFNLNMMYFYFSRNNMVSWLQYQLQCYVYKLLM